MWKYRYLTISEISRYDIVKNWILSHLSCDKNNTFDENCWMKSVYFRLFMNSSICSTDLF